MKKNKDWTRVLQERLQDAELPVDGVLPPTAPSFAGSTSPSFAGLTGESPAARPSRWWPYALAGVAAAIVAAVLLLRPASNPVQESDYLVETAPVPDAGKEELVVLLPQSDPSLLADGFTSERQPSPRTRPTAPDSAGQRAQADAQPAHGLPQDGSSAPSSTGPTSPSFAGVTGESPSSNTAYNEDEEAEIELPSSNQATGEDAGAKIAIASSNPVENEDGWDFPEEPGTRRSQRSRISLRVHAATAGTSFSGSATPMLNLPQPGLTFGRWVAAENASAINSFGLLNPNDVPLPNGDGIKWVYVQQLSDNEVRMVSVPKAPVLPVTVGVSLSLSLSRSWTLSAGLDYMQRDGYRLYNDQPQSLTLHYLGIPVDLQYYFNPESRWRVYLGAGLQAAKCIAATGGQPAQDPVLFSGNLMAGTDFRLFPGVRLYLAPVLSVPFNRSAYVNSWDDRLQFQMRAGLSFDLK